MEKLIQEFLSLYREKLYLIYSDDGDNGLADFLLEKEKSFVEGEFFQRFSPLAKLKYLVSLLFSGSHLIENKEKAEKYVNKVLFFFERFVDEVESSDKS